VIAARFIHRLKAMVSGRIMERRATCRPAECREIEVESVEERPFSDEDYRAIAAFRAGLRRFVRFSEDAARAVGLSPQQHQLLVAIRGHAGPEPPTIGDLADALQIRHHSAVGLVDRMVHGGYVRRETSTVDSRRVHVLITPEGDAVLRSLTAAHRREHHQLQALLQRLIVEAETASLDETGISVLAAAPDADSQVGGPSAGPKG
jgi:DNA-binding MarR family transcriptional regulator